MTPQKSGRLAGALAVLFWLAVWQLASVAVGQKLLLASPLDVLAALAQLLPTAAFWQRIAFSAAHILCGLLLALALGTALGALAASHALAALLLRPLMRAVKAVPVASFIILALVWLGGAKRLSVFISFLTVLPVVYENVREGFAAADAKLLEMAAVFRVPRLRRLRYIRLPAVLPYFRSACGVALGVCWKSGVAAEVIGIAAGSIGEALYNAKVLFDTAGLLAWTAVIVLLSAAFEKLFLLALCAAEKRLTGGAAHD